MHFWRMSLGRTKSAIISWDGSFRKHGNQLYVQSGSRFWLQEQSAVNLHCLLQLVYPKNKAFYRRLIFLLRFFNWALSSEFVSWSIPSWQISTAHVQSFRGARDLAFCLKVPLDSLLVWASSEGSGETARMRRLAWTFAARIGDKYQIRLTRSNSQFKVNQGRQLSLGQSLH